MGEGMDTREAFSDPVYLYCRTFHLKVNVSAWEVTLYNSTLPSKVRIPLHDSKKDTGSPLGLRCPGIDRAARQSIYCHFK